MPMTAIISQKGGAGKTTVAVHLAAAAELAGHTGLVFDTDQQATASQGAAWRKGTLADRWNARLGKGRRGSASPGTGPILCQGCRGGRLRLGFRLARTQALS